MRDQLWTVVLAAGAGKRLAAVTGGVPKQFYRAPCGTSLLGQTLDRLQPLAPPSRTVVIVDASHVDYVVAGEVAGAGTTVVVQPRDRGTAAGVLLALTPVLDTQPDAIVVITPSDHGVLDDATFRRGVAEAARRAQQRNDLVLFGVEAAAPRDDYGWISLGEGSEPGGFVPVSAFVEKPTSEVATRLLARGAVWNTMVIVGRASAIRDLYVELLPDLHGVFDAALRLPPAERGTFLESAYAALPAHDFSRDVLGRARRLSAYIWPAAMGWSDLGTPERLHQWYRVRCSARARRADRSADRRAGRTAQSAAGSGDDSRSGYGRAASTISTTNL
ncbi:MAG: NTP transferase domain-containing protein [Acidobacteria bacterium]|nr:NTP transferase domain-containing protein [Acidobacteriota bacterium]